MNILRQFLGFAVLMAVTSQAHAKSEYLSSAISTYPDIANTRLDSCTLCHTNVPNRNDFGRDWAQAGKNFAAIEGDDSDGDGVLNLAEIEALTFPGDSSDFPDTGDPVLCTVLANSASNLTAFRSAFGVSTTDLGGLGLPDAPALALAREGTCGASSSVATATQAAYDINLAYLMNSTFPGNLAGHEGILAALLLTSSETKAALVGILQTAGVTLSTTDFEVVMCDGGGCLPTAVKADGSYETGAAAFKQTSDEPYSANGDFDGDGFTNKTEFDNVDAQGGGTTDFVNAATDPAEDGTSPIGGGGCAAGPAPTGSATEWPVLLALVLAGLMASGRRQMTSAKITR